MSIAKILRRSVALVMTVFTATASAYEEPKHTVLEQIGAIQIRQYQSSLLAAVEVTGERDKAINQGFRILAGYIFGGNTVKQKIAMTAPVTQTDAQSTEPTNMKIAMTTPVTQTAVGGTAGEVLSGDAVAGQRWRVTFTMPSEFTMDSLPTPNDKRVKIIPEPGKKLAAIKFSGTSNVNNLTNHRVQLETFVKERGLKTSGPYTVAYYDDPFTLPWNRRNEWWVAIE